MLSPIQIRHTLHANPELSGEESNTSAFIVEQLRQLGIQKIHTGFAPHAVVAEIDGQQAGKTYLFRAELDALPIQETNDFGHKSQKNGVSHKCGHDGHSATLLAFAQKLQQQKHKFGKVLLFFQSAEETGKGTKQALDSGFFDQFSIAYVFAYHNLPNFPLGTILCKAGTFTPCVESILIELIGKSCHASEPANGINPAEAIADIIRYFGKLHQTDRNHPNYFVTTPIFINMGEKSYGTSAGYAQIGYTIRTWDNRRFEKYKEKIINKVTKICEKAQLSFKMTWLEPFKSNNNHLEAFQKIEAASRINGFPFIHITEPFNFGEDFGLFTEYYKGAMFGIGSGENCPALHTADYDFPDVLIEIGSDMFMQLLDSEGIK